MTRGIALGAVLFGLLTTVDRAAAPASARQRLQQLVRLPRMTFRFGMEFNPEHGFSLSVEEDAARREVASLERTLHRHPDDPAQQFRLAVLYRDSLHHRKRGVAAAQVALDLYRRQGAEQSEDPELLAKYGAVLDWFGQTAEAERALRKAVRLAPDDWHSQLALGQFLTRHVAEEFQSESPTNKTPHSLLELTTNPALYRPTPAQVDIARQRMSDALAALNAAVHLAPKEAAPYAARALGYAVQSWMTTRLRLAQGEEKDTHALVNSPFTTEVLPDLWEAARLRPKDARTWGTAALVQLYADWLRPGHTIHDLVTRDAWSGLPERSRERLRATMNRLEQMGQEGEPDNRVSAWEVLGTLQFLLGGDRAAAVGALRCATRMDPQSNAAWETWVALLAATKRFDDILVVCRARLRYQDSARNRLLLAKTYEQLGQLDRALAVTEAAWQRYPNDFATNLALAAALMRLDTSAATLQRANALLTIGARRLTRPLVRPQIVSLFLLRGLLLGLAGEIEKARATLSAVLAIDPSNATAKEALRLLAQPE